MKIHELYLCGAIHKAELGGKDRPTSSQRKEAAEAVMSAYLDLFEDSYFPFTIDDIEQWRIRLRKTTETTAKVEIALAHGFKCYFHGRGKGPCSDDLEAGHVVPRCKGGPLTVANGQIECRAHNNQRREMTIEEYLSSNLTTEATDGR